MSLSQKTILILSLTIFILVSCITWIQHRNFKKLKSEEIYSTMNTILTNGQETINGYAELQSSKAFDEEKLLEDLNNAHDFRKTDYYKSVPVVAGLTSMKASAKVNGFHFKPAKIQARNPENTPTMQEMALIEEFIQTNAKVINKIDEDNNLIYYAKPIVITTSCLKCHGDPATSPNGDGTDVFGFKMENWEAGKTVGAYILSSPLERLNEPIRASLFNMISILLPLGVIAVIFGVIYVRKSVIVPIRSSIANLKEETHKSGASADQLLNISNSVNAGTQRQAVAISQIKDSAHSIYLKFKGSEDNDHSTDEMALSKTHEALTAIDSGLLGLESLNQNIEDILESSREITQIVRTIDSIAFQTNLLALNAAVEAARAGEAGAGFAVVAEEVRVLARRTSEAAQTTAGIVQKSIQSTSGTSEISNEITFRLADVKERIDWLLKNNLQVSELSEQQLKGIEEIQDALEEIHKVTESNAKESDSASRMTTDVSSSVIEINEHVATVQKQILGS